MPGLLAIPTIDTALRGVRAWTEWPGAWRFLIVFALVLLLAWGLKKLFFRILERFAAAGGTNLDDTLLGALRWPARYWIVLIALVAAVNGLDEQDIPAKVAHALNSAIVILFAVSLTTGLARVSIVLLQHSMRRMDSGIEVTALTRTLIRLFWAVPAVLVALSVFGVNIGLAWGTLGVGGLAVSLALKDTLANVFAGFYVSLSGQLHKGDYIRLDTGIEGYVIDIHWRLTTLRTLNQNLVLIPNSRLAEAIVTNLSQPSPPLVASIAYHVAYDTDLELLDRVVLDEVARAQGELPGLLATPAPSNRLIPGFGDSVLNFTLGCGVANVEAQYSVGEQLRRRLLKRFLAEGIRMPYPAQSFELVRGAKAPKPEP